MKRITWIVLAGTCAVLIGMGGMFCGCEDTPTMANLDSFFAAHPTFPDPRVPGNRPLTVIPNPSPPVVEFVGDTVSLLALGGPSEYEWWIVDPAAGRFVQNDNHTDTVVYEALRLVENTVYVMDSRGRAAVVDIEATARALAIQPGSASVPSNSVVSINFLVVNGAGGYVWTMSHPDQGEFSPAPAVGDTMATYKSKKVASGQNTITVVDQRGTLATATVTVE